MGLFRKMTSVSTAGLVDFKSDKERTATYAKQSAKEAKKQTALMRQQAAAGQPAYAPPAYPAPSYAPPVPPPPAAAGYYVPPPSERRPVPGNGPVAPHTPAGADAAPPSDLMTQLTKLGEMKQAGLLTDDEFAAAKTQLLGTT